MGAYQTYIELLADERRWEEALPILNQAVSEALPDLIEGMSHPNWVIRKWCVALLDHHVDEQTVCFLQRALQDPHSDVRRLAVHAIGCEACKQETLKVDVVGLLIERLIQDQSLKVKRVAANMLGEQPPDPRATRALQHVLGETSDHRLAAIARRVLQHHAASAALEGAQTLGSSAS